MVNQSHGLYFVSMVLSCKSSVHASLWDHFLHSQEIHTYSLTAAVVVLIVAVAAPIDAALALATAAVAEEVAAIDATAIDCATVVLTYIKRK